MVDVVKAFDEKVVGLIDVFLSRLRVSRKRRARSLLSATCLSEKMYVGSLRSVMQERVTKSVALFPHHRGDVMAVAQLGQDGN